MQKEISDASIVPGWSPALGGLTSAIVGSLFIAQAGGSDQEFFLSVGFILCAIGLLGIVTGGVALGIRLARN